MKKVDFKMMQYLLALLFFALGIVIFRADKLLNRGEAFTLWGIALMFLVNAWRLNLK